MDLFFIHVLILRFKIISDITKRSNNNSRNNLEYGALEPEKQNSGEIFVTSHLMLLLRPPAVSAEQCLSILVGTDVKDVNCVCVCVTDRLHPRLTVDLEVLQQRPVHTQLRHQVGHGPSVRRYGRPHLHAAADHHNNNNNTVNTHQGSPVRRT